MLFEPEPLVRQHTLWSGVINVLLFVALLGAVHLGIVGVFGFNAIEWLVGDGAAARALEAIVGLCGLVSLLALPSLRVVLRHDMRTRANPEPRQIPQDSARMRQNDLDVTHPPPHRRDDASNDANLYS